jgi:D-serine deaminase-like pyridoxal phosphate-dependent protein
MTTLLHAPTAPERAIVSPTEPIDTPLLVIDETIMHRNISEMAALAKSLGVALRPHIKTHKTPQIARLQLASGAIGITCAKLGEAEVMVDAGVDDILIAYPLVGELKIRRLLALMERARVMVAVDSHEVAEALSDAMVAADRVLGVYVEVNTGQNRAGVLVGDPTVTFATEVARLPGLRLVGIMSHEGHANHQPRDLIQSVAVEAGQRLVETAEAIRGHGIDLPVVSVGSTPAAAYTPSVSGITEMRPGTYVFRDASGFQFGIFGPDRCAARLVATVVSRPAPDRCVIDTGSKSLTSDTNSGHPGHGYIVGHPGAIIARLSEEHGVVEISPDDSGLNIGDRIEIIPNHICPVVNLMDELTIVHEGLIVDRWPVAARGKIR